MPLQWVVVYQICADFRICSFIGWSDDYLLDDSNIMAFIRKLRKKIEPDPDAPRYILTIWGIGYKFNDQL